jgi:hypothetical protein
MFIISLLHSCQKTLPEIGIKNRFMHMDREDRNSKDCLLIVSFLTLGALMLMHCPQKVNAFLNSDEPVESKHVVTSGMIR